MLHRLQLAGLLLPGEREADRHSEVTGEDDLKEVVDKIKAFKKRTLHLSVVSRSESEEDEGNEMEEGDEEVGGGYSCGGGRKRRKTLRDLKWLMRRMSRLASYEAGHHPKDSVKVCLLSHSLRH